MEQNNVREGGRRVHSFIPSPEARTIGSFVCFFPSIGHVLVLALVIAVWS